MNRVPVNEAGKLIQKVPPVTNALTTRAAVGIKDGVRIIQSGRKKYFKGLKIAIII